MSGKSYFHVPQPPGKFIDPKSINGYYNDLRKKAAWEGASDEQGVPVNILSNGDTVYFPITVSQMALGIYDLWIETQEPSHIAQFLKLAEWLKSNLDEGGGWINPWNYTRPTALTNYSAMAQGEGISVLARAYLKTGDSSLKHAADKAFQFMMTPVENGGCTYYTNGDIYLEEYPESPRSTVLNGFIFALFGVYDYMLLTGKEDVQGIFNACISTIEGVLERYDTGYWTYYDLCGTIASPFYHSLHISLLDSLYILTGSETFKSFSARWASYEKNLACKTRAVLAKMSQKLKNPAHVTIKI